MKSFYLNGNWCSSPEFETIFNPWSGEKIADVCLASPEQIESAIASAHAAFQITRKLSNEARASVLENIGALISKRRQEFVDVIVAEAGKPVTFAKSEVDRACVCFRMAAAQALADEGHGLNMDASAAGTGHFGLVKRFPMGVLFGITPFNFPLNLVVHKVAPCLATGNTMLLKPALKTPLSALLLAEILEEAGVPPGQINIVPFDHKFIDPLLTDPRIRMLSFTGSVDVGWNLKSRASKMKCALELGGNAAVVIEPDSDWSAAIPSIASAAFGFAGQSCISIQRILVNKRIYQNFKESLLTYVINHIHIGDPSDPKTLVGPMINSLARQKILDWVQEATQAGASLLTPRVVEGRSILGPVLLENVPLHCAAIQEEAFAPLAVMHAYENFEEALTMVNNSRFGLQAGIFTENLSKALQAYEELDIGGVMINQVPTFRVENMPYGGVKESGFGREGIRYAMEEMTEPRSLVIRQK